LKRYGTKKPSAQLAQKETKKHNKMRTKVKCT